MTARSVRDLSVLSGRMLFTSETQDDRRRVMDLDLDIECPECGTNVKIKMADVSRQRTVRCRQGHAIELVDEGGGAREVEKSMRDLDKQISKLGRTFKF